MSFVRPELAAFARRWREPAIWGALTLLGAWLAWRGYAAVAPLPFILGLICAGFGVGLLQGALRQLRLRTDAMETGVVVIDEAQIAYLGPREGGVIDLPAVVRVEIVTRPHLPPDSGHAWVITAEDGNRLTIPLGARGADALLDALAPLPGIDFDAGVAAVVAGGPGRTTVWRKAG